MNHSEWIYSWIKDWDMPNVRRRIFGGDVSYDVSLDERNVESISSTKDEGIYEKERR